MIEEKERLLKRYYGISERMLDSLHKGQEDEIPGLLKQREDCIEKIDRLDQEAGVLLMNNRIENRLKQQARLEEELLQHLQQALRKLSNRMRFAENDQYLKSQYEERTTVSKGVFYDRKK